MTIVNKIIDIFNEFNQEPYGEDVSITEHMLLTAQAAKDLDHNEAFVVACLLHDVGHCLEAPDDKYGNHSHAEIGGNWLATYFPSEISEPVRLHVAAKRYLCAIDTSYHDKLSDASVYTLSKQGGAMNEEEVARFEQQPFYKEAVALRKLEDRFGKLTDAPVPDLTQFVTLISNHVTNRS